MQAYELTAVEQRHYRDVLDGIDANGGLFQADRDGNIITDAVGNPVSLDYVVLRSRRFLVDKRGTVWRYFPEGSPKDLSTPNGGGPPWRNNRIEMWTGKWRKVTSPDGNPTYAKVLTARPIDKRINGRPEMSQIEWYLAHKGFKECKV